MLSLSNLNPNPNPNQAMLSLDFWLMLVPKAVLFTHTQF